MNDRMQSTNFVSVHEKLIDDAPLVGQVGCMPSDTPQPATTYAELARQDGGSPEAMGLRLGAVRLAAGQTQSEFAKAIGLQKAVIGNWETAKSTPRPNTIAEICKTFRVSADFVLLGDLSRFSQEDRQRYVEALVRMVRQRSITNAMQCEALANSKRNYLILRQNRFPFLNHPITVGINIQRGCALLNRFAKANPSLFQTPNHFWGNYVI